MDVESPEMFSWNLALVTGPGVDQGTLEVEFGLERQATRTDSTQGCATLHSGGGLNVSMMATAATLDIVLRAPVHGNPCSTNQSRAASSVR